MLASLEMNQVTQFASKNSFGGNLFEWQRFLVTTFIVKTFRSKYMPRDDLREQDSTKGPILALALIHPDYFTLHEEALDLGAGMDIRPDFYPGLALTNANRKQVTDV